MMVDRNQATRDETSDHSGRRHRNLKKPGPFTTLAALVAALMVPVLIYFSYDLLGKKLAPCDAIFKQTTVALSTKIKFLETEGEVQVGREPVADLGERAQMTALNLKTCCTVLDAGKLNPEEFLQCKQKARNYESRVENIVQLVQAAMKSSAATAATANTGTASATTTIAAAPPADVKAKIKQGVEAARKVSKSFNQQIVQVTKDRALERLEVAVPKHVEVAAKEREPNNDVLHTNVIKLGEWITGAIGSGKDQDFYRFSVPEVYRDWITVEIENRSTSLEPSLKLYNADKTFITHQYNTTAGGNLKYSFVAAPKAIFMVDVSNYYGKSKGIYLLRIFANKSWDEFEPNDSIFDAKAMTPAKPIRAGVMDGGDIDFFRFETGEKAGPVTVNLANKSTTLRPYIKVFDAAKNEISNQYSTTGGADLTFNLNAKAKATYYLRIGDYYGKIDGKYELTVSGK